MINLRKPSDRSIYFEKPVGVVVPKFPDGQTLMQRTGIIPTDRLADFDWGHEEPIIPTFNRDDICAAYYQIEVDYNVNGVLKERPSNQRRRESSDCQLRRCNYEGCFIQGFLPLSENAQAIYRLLEDRYGFTN